MYGAKLRSDGFIVYSAFDGEQGLKLALEKKPSAILLDVMMPKMSGVDFLTRIRQDPWGKSVAVLVLSNLSQDEEIKKALALGAKEYLTKANVTPAQVTEKIKSYLKK